MTFDAKGVLSTSVHILLHHYYSFTILILNPLVIRTHCTLQKKKTSFFTSTLRWCHFFNLFIIDCEILPMFNSLLICKSVVQKNDQITKCIVILDIEN